MNLSRRILISVPERLVGERVVVRPFTDADAPAFHEAIRESVEHVRPWLPWYSLHETVEDTLEFIRHAQADFLRRDGFSLGVFDGQDELPLGGVGLHPRDWRVPSFEIGYWLRLTAEGKGYMKEAVRLVTALAFDSLGAERVMIRCDARNLRSQRVPERLGYVREGCLRRQEIDTSGGLADMVVYSMLAEEYRRSLCDS